MDAGGAHDKIPLMDKGCGVLRRAHQGLRTMTIESFVSRGRTDPRLADGGRQELAAIDVARLSAMSGTISGPI
jgi:hypothetical protein